MGKFNPPHLGHVELIEAGAAQIEHLYVLLCDRPDQTLAVRQRHAWLADASPPNVTVLVTPDDLPAANKPWAARALEILPTRPDVAFTSEPWGSGWAQLMGARHVHVAGPRASERISATMIRDNLGKYFFRLVPAARAALARRVVVIGTESAGKSTMADALAHELGTVWVPEHGRSYWEGRRYIADHGWHTDEFRRIAAAQHALENDLARRATRGLVVADTNALVTAVWHERYMGHRDPVLEAAWQAAKPDLYLMCFPDFPWVQDGTRESRDERIWMHEAMLSRAYESGVAVESLQGTHHERLRRAMQVVEPLTVFPLLV